MRIVFDDQQCRVGGLQDRAVVRQLLDRQFREPHSSKGRCGGWRRDAPAVTAIVADGPTYLIGR